MGASHKVPIPSKYVNEADAGVGVGDIHDEKYKKEIICRFLSIIVPVYNVVTYLREGLDSILRQEVQDIEVICVDDCSSDSSPDILKEYQAKDNRIQFIRQSENKGPSATRNIGIKYAKGKYIAFFDPDDKVENNHMPN